MGRRTLLARMWDRQVALRAEEAGCRFVHAEPSSPQRRLRLLLLLRDLSPRLLRTGSLRFEVSRVLLAAKRNPPASHPVIGLAVAVIVLRNHGIHSDRPQCWQHVAWPRDRVRVRRPHRP
jgi:hypothetical protein